MQPIEEFRRAIGMSQREFSNHFGIPIGTLRNWEQKIARPPEYVFQMIFKIMERDRNMIDIETVKFKKMIEDLTALSIKGIDSFNNATAETLSSKIFYDEKTKDNEGNCRIVLDACIIDEHHDAVSYYDSYNENKYTVKVNFYEDTNKPYVVVKLATHQEIIVIENGNWYFT